MQTKFNFVCIYTHKSTAAMKNTPTILTVSSTRLLIELSIIVIILGLLTDTLKHRNNEPK